MGDEQSAYTAKYAGTTVVDTTYYFYGDSSSNTKAGTSTVNKAMYASQTLKLTAAISGTGLDTSNTNQKSITYYTNGVGDEQSAYTAKYAGTTVVDTTYYFYGDSSSNKQGQHLDGQQGYVRKPDTEADSRLSGTGLDTSNTNQKSITYYTNGVGDEQSAYTIKYAGTTVVRHHLLLLRRLLVRRQGQHLDGQQGDVRKPDTEADSRHIGHRPGHVQHKPEVDHLLYQRRGRRAVGLHRQVRRHHRGRHHLLLLRRFLVQRQGQHLDGQQGYVRKSDTEADNRHMGTGLDTSNTNQKSITYYTNGVGDEQSAYTAKYAGTTVVDTTYYFYGDSSSKRKASTSTVNKAMYASQTLKLTAAISGTGLDTSNTNQKSITYYTNGVGDEQSAYTAKYAGTTVVDTTYYFYGDSSVQAQGQHLDGQQGYVPARH